MSDSVFRLVKWTVQYATERSPYYRQTIGAVKLSDWAAFRELPIIDRKTLAQRSRAMRVPGISVSHVGTTAGTTSFKSVGDSAPLLIYRSEDERRAAHDLARHLSDNLHDDGGLVLRLLDASHGHDLSIGSTRILGVPFAEPHHIDIVASLLGDRFETEQGTQYITSIAGSHFMLKLLTMGLACRGIDLARSNIRLVVSKGGLLTRRWRRLLARVWRASITDVYGVSEVPGFHCMTCAQCGGFRPAKTAYVEYLNPDTCKEAQSGVSRLIVTALFPLAEIVPVIRYDTGDIVYRDPKRTASCKHCFTLLGRASDLVKLPNTRAFVSRLRIADILDSFPPIQRLEEQPLAEQLGVRADLGLPIFTIGEVGCSGGLDELSLTTQVRRVDTFRQLAQAANLSERLREAAFPPETRDGIVFRLEEIEN